MKMGYLTMRFALGCCFSLISRDFRGDLLGAFRGVLLWFASFYALVAHFPVQAATFKAVPLDGGGWVSGFAQADDGRLYAYGDVFGAWRSDNGGANWSYLNWGIPGGDIVGYGMAVEQNNADVVYYSTNTSLWKSTDGGATWSALLTDLGENTPRFRGSAPILIRCNDPQELWFAGPRKNLTGWLWRSKDGGATWSKAGGSAFDSNRARTLHNTAANPNQIWVGAEDGLYVSTNGGATFDQVSGLSEVGMIQRFSSGPHVGVGLVTRGNIDGDGGGISRITARDFEDASTYLATRSQVAGLHFGYPTGLQIFSDGTCSAWNTPADRHGFSTDGGQLFSIRPTTVNTTNVPIWTTAAEMTAKNHPDYGTDQVIEDVTNPNKWIITGGGAAMFSLDKGHSWQYFPNGSGLAAVKTYAVGVSRHDVNRIYIPASDIGSAIVTDGGASGTAVFSSHQKIAGLQSCFRIMEGPDTQHLVLAGVDQGSNCNLILRSTDGGANWKKLDLTSSGLPRSTEGITKCVMSLTDANDYLVVLSAQGGNAGVWRTTNGGANFRQASGLPEGLSTGHRYEPTACFLERDATALNTRYFVSRRAADNSAPSTGLYKSTDRGANWKHVSHPFGPSAWVWCLAADPVRSGNLWAAGADSGVKVSRNGGRDWTSTAQYFKCRFVASCDGKVALFGQAEGNVHPRLYYSNDDGETFTALTSADHNFHGVQGLAVDRNGKIWVSWNSCTVVDPSARR